MAGAAKGFGSLKVSMARVRFTAMSNPVDESVMEVVFVDKQKTRALLSQRDRHFDLSSITGKCPAGIAIGTDNQIVRFVRDTFGDTTAEPFDR